MTRPVDPALFSSVEPLRLLGSRCDDCAATTFPAQADCPRCARRTMSDVELPDHGSLWSWTIQTFQPKPPYVAPPEGFAPFPVGYVDLGDLVVEGRLDADPHGLAVGEAMRLVPAEIHDSEGAVALGYAFVPDEGMRP